MGGWYFYEIVYAIILKILLFIFRPILKNDNNKSNKMGGLASEMLQKYIIKFRFGTNILILIYQFV